MPASESASAPGTRTIFLVGFMGAGKSSVTDEIVRRFLNGFPEKTIAVFPWILQRKRQAVHYWVIASV